MILGVDLSTSISGYAVIDGNGVLTLNESVNTKRNADSVYESAEQNIQKIEEILDRFDVEHVFIEENLQTFRTGFSSAQVLSKLSKINGIVCYHFYKERGQIPELINPRTARKEAGLTMNKEKKQKIKEEMIREGKSESYADSKKTKMVVHRFVQENEPYFDFDYTYAGNPKPESFDRADAVIVARAGEKRLKNQK